MTTMTKTKAKAKKKATKKAAKKPPIPRSPAGKRNLAGLTKRDGEALQPKDVTTVDEFLRTGESNTYWGLFPCFVEECRYDRAMFAVRRNGQVQDCGNFCDGAINGYVYEKPSSQWHTESAVAVLIKSRRTGWKFGLVLDGEDRDEGDMAVEVADKEAAVTSSFGVLSELLSPLKGRRLSSGQVLNMLTSDQIRILDSRPDETRETTAEVKRKIGNLNAFEARKKVRPPEAGFTLMRHNNGWQWHRAATILFSYGKNVYIVGQDDGSYFGCQLVDKPKTIDGAYLSLIPESLRKVNGLERQGEWFLVPVAANKVSKLEDCIATFSHENDTSIILPRDSEHSNPHTIMSSDGRISADGVFVKGGCIYHDQHDEVRFSSKQWITFIKNTAVRAVSREGVD